jgi:hypothetical protein
MYAGLGLFDAAERIAGDAPAHVLIADAAGHDVDALGIAGIGALRELAHHGIGHVVEDLVERLELVVVGVDVDDGEILVAAIFRLAGGVREHFSGVEFLDLHATVVAERKFHGRAFLVARGITPSRKCLRRGGPRCSFAGAVFGRPRIRRS